MESLRSRKEEHQPFAARLANLDTETSYGHRTSQEQGENQLLDESVHVQSQFEKVGQIFTQRYSLLLRSAQIGGSVIAGPGRVGSTVRSSIKRDARQAERPAETQRSGAPRSATMNTHDKNQSFKKSGKSDLLCLGMSSWLSSENARKFGTREHVFPRFGESLS